MKCNTYIKWLIGIAVIMSFLIGCDDMDATYEEFIRNGEIIYTAKTDSIQVHPGDGRIKLSWQLPPDPTVEYVRVFWNNGSDSVEVPVEYQGQLLEMDVLIEGLTEGIHHFDLITYDGRGNKSVRVSIEGEVFGDDYRNFLKSRSILEENVRVVDFRGTIDWGMAHSESIGSELIYTDRDGKTDTISVSPSDEISIIENIKLGSTIRYRTLFQPDTLAIDTFYSAYEEMILPRYSEIGKDKITKYVLPNDEIASLEPQYGVEKMWDNNTGTTFRSARSNTVPSSFTLDLGRIVNLRGFRYNQRVEPNFHRWARFNPRLFEIWGMADTPSADGSWTGWTKLRDVVSVKPADAAEANRLVVAGEEFDIPEESPPVRYIRIRVNETWQNRQEVHIAELTFWEE